MSLTPSERFLGRLFVDPGTGSDVDEAFEDATDTARIEFGLSGVLASVASLSASDVVVVSDVPSSLGRTFLEVSRGFNSEGREEGVAYAYAYASDAQFRRRKVNLKVEDDLKLSSKLGVYSHVSPDLEEELIRRLGEQGVTLEDGEFLEAVELKSYRARYKPVVTPHPGRNKNTFVATLHGSPFPVASGSTAGEARRNAVARVKEGPFEGLDLYTLDVSVTARREDGSPLFEIERTLVSQKATLRLTIASAKKPELKTTGWVFSGFLPSEP